MTPGAPSNHVTSQHGGHSNHSEVTSRFGERGDLHLNIGLAAGHESLHDPRKIERQSGEVCDSGLISEF